MADRRAKQDRRTRHERRRLRDRHRASNQMHTVIQIVDDELYTICLDRSNSESPDQLREFSLPWRKQAATIHSDEGVRELTAALIELAATLDLHTTTVSFVLGGEYCVTKAVRGTNEEVRTELQQIEQRSRLYLMLGPGEKVTVRHLHPLDARHAMAIAAVCNSATLDAIHEAASRAGLIVESIEPALVATSRALGRLEDGSDVPYLLIHLSPSTVELAICHQGNLLLDYRPGGRKDPAELLQLLLTHLSRLERHVGRQLHEPPPKLRKIYLCGHKPLVDKAYSAFAASSRFETERVDPARIQATWKFEKQLSGSAAVPALGALLSTYLPAAEREAPNFMQHIIASTREPLKPILLKSMAPLAAVLIVAACGLAFNYVARKDLAELEVQLDDLAVVQARHREVSLTKGASLAKLAQLRDLAEGLQALPAGEVIARIGQCMPSDVWLSRMEVAGMQQIQIDGASYLEAGVFDFVRWLEQAPGFEDVALRSTRPGQSEAGPAINFNIELNLGDWDGQVEEVARNE